MIAETLQEFAIKHTDLLVGRAAKGDEQAFSKLMGLWYKRIFNFCYKYFQDHDLAMEVTQKAFISVHKGLPKLKDNGSFKPWLYRITLNKCHEEERKMKRKSWVSIFMSDKNNNEKEIIIEESATGVFYNPTEKLEARETAEIVLESLGQIPEEQRTVLIMKEYEGMKFREIAVVLDISENTAKSRLYYGLKAMKKILEGKNIMHYGH